MPDGSKALTHQAVLLEIKGAAVAEGLAHPDRVSSHVLRHAFAAHMHAGGTDLRVLLGHDGIGTSRLHHMVRYLHPLMRRGATAA